MDGEGMSDHLWEDGAGPRPGSDYAFLASRIHALNFLE
jgi:hypothetical protein